MRYFIIRIINDLVTYFTILTCSACFKISSLDIVFFLRSNLGVTLSLLSLELNSGAISSNLCKARSLSNEVAQNNNCLVSNGNKNGQHVAICCSQFGKFPVIITKGSCNCRLAFAAILLFRNSDGGTMGLYSMY